MSKDREKGNALIEQLRHEGKGLSAIAKTTGLSINTIKSHYTRHGIPASQHIRTCMFCHAEFKTTARFCSDACRAGWYEIHSSDAPDILRRCKACGKPFEPRQPKQVYCSTQCFYNDRYHSKQVINENESLKQMLLLIPREAAVALVKRTMEFLLASGWQSPDTEHPFDPLGIADLLYTQISQNSQRD